MNHWYPVIALPHDAIAFTTPSCRRGMVSFRWVFLTWSAPRDPFVQPGRADGRAHRPIPADNQWSRATASSLYLALLPSCSRLFQLPTLFYSVSLSLFLNEILRVFLFLAYLISVSYSFDETSYSGPYINDA